MRLEDPSGHRDVALGLCRDAGKVLMVWNARVTNGTAERWWDLPGGSVERGETVAAAVACEWEEEVGFRAHVGDLLMVADGAKRTSPEAPPLYTWRAFVFHVAPPPFGALPVPGPEIERVEWVVERDAPMRL